MPPSTPTTSMSPGRLALLEPANTPLRKAQLQHEQAIVKERYLGHAAVSAIVLTVAAIDRFYLGNWLLDTATRGMLATEMNNLLNMAVMVFSLVWAVCATAYSFQGSEERGGVTGDTGSKKASTVMTSTPALSNASLPMTPQMGSRSRPEEAGVISPIFPIPDNTIFGTPQQSPLPAGLRNRRVDYRPLYGASSPSRPDLSWIEEHEFGGTAGRAAGGGGAASKGALSFQSTPRSHSASFASGPSSPASMGASLITDLTSSAPFQARVASLPSTKMLTSIHTQEQVDALLAKSRSDSAASAAAGGAAGDKMNQSSSFYQAMLQLDGLELHPYQMSRDAAESKTDPYHIVYDVNGGAHLSPRSAGTSPTGSDDTSRFRVELAAQRAAAMAAAAAAGGASPIDGRRRRLSHHSSSSPSRGGSVDGSTSGGSGGAGGAGVGRRRKGDSHSSLSESELARTEQRLRVWMVITIIRPIHDGIRALNLRFEKELAALHLRIGISTVEQITAALTAHPELAQTTLPYLIPYLRVCTNQAYLVSRLASLSVGSCMADFSWASGGPQPADAEGAGAVKTPASLFSTPLVSRLAARPWNESLPTDTQLVLALFCAYMDTRVTSCALVQGHNVDQPFASRYTLVAPAKPTALHQAAGAFYVHLASLNPPSLEFVSVAADSQATVTTRHVFRALVLFLTHAQHENDGRIDRLQLNSPSLNLDVVLNGY